LTRRPLVRCAGLQSPKSNNLTFGVEAPRNALTGGKSEWGSTPGQQLANNVLEILHGEGLREHRNGRVKQELMALGERAAAPTISWTSTGASSPFTVGSLAYSRFVRCDNQSTLDNLSALN